MNIDILIEKYKPICNHLSNDHSYLYDPDTDKEYAFETYGDELDFVLQQDDKNIWTIHDDGTVQNGYWLVNRLAYIVCENKCDIDKGHIAFNYYEDSTTDET